MSVNPIDTFMDVLKGAPLDRRQQQFVAAVLTILGTQLSRYTPAGREHVLQEIADSGALVRLGQRLCCEGSLSPPNRWLQ